MLESIIIIIYTVCTLNTMAIPTDSDNSDKTEAVIFDDSDGILEIVIVDGQN